MSKFVATLLILAGTIASSVTFAETYTRDDVSKLQQDCYRQRAEHIAPLKAEEMERCINEQGKDRSWCENDLQTFGEASGRRPGMFWDLPECELAFDVERYFQRYPGKKSYTP